MTAYSSFIFKYKTINYGASRAGYAFKLIKVSMTDVSGTGPNTGSGRYSSGADTKYVN